MAAHLWRNVLRREYFKCILRQAFCINRRFFNTKTSPPLTGVFLESKGHIEVTGKDAVKFLNGLLTNDVNLFHCDSQMSALYCMMLNSKGRVLYDLMLYKLKESLDIPSFLLECDSGAVGTILKSFKPYKLRSQVEFMDVSRKFDSWCILEEGAHENLRKRNSGTDVVLIEDPRLSILGVRMVLPKSKLPSEYGENIKDVMDEGVYDNHRVRHGVSEGLKDIESGVALPLEYNITELHGVSYQKGCYIGQELTARIHHTGVLRKRIMPIKLAATNERTDLNFEKNASIKTTSGKAAGKLKSIYGNLGLGLMRLDTVKSADGLSIAMSDGTSVSVIVDWPLWWSRE